MSSRYYRGSTLEVDNYLGSTFEGDIIYVGSTLEVEINDMIYLVSRYFLGSTLEVDKMTRCTTQ